MPIFNRKDLAGYSIEIIVVALGILIAFQVEEWRESRQIQEELDLAIARLVDETAQNKTFCANFIERRGRVLRSVETGRNSLQAGKLEEADVEKFGIGLSVVSSLPNVPLFRTVTDEMIATGLLKHVADADLKRLVSMLQGLGDFQDRAYVTDRESVRDLSRELANHIEIVYAQESGSPVASAIGLQSTESDIFVNYDFSEMAESRRLKFLFYEAFDAHSDFMSSLTRRCDVVSQIDARLADLYRDSET